MRTTVDIDEDVLRAAKALAEDREQSLGRVLSDLARRGLQPSGAKAVRRSGLPVLPRLPGARPVTPEHVKELLEQD